MELIPGLLIEWLIDVLPRRAIIVGCATVGMAVLVTVLWLLPQ